MAQIEIITKFIYQYELLVFLVYLLLSFICATIIDKIFILSLKKFVRKTKTDLDDKLIDILHPAIYYTILFVGFYLAINAISVPDKINYIFIIYIF